MSLLPPHCLSALRLNFLFKYTFPLTFFTGTRKSLAPKLDNRTYIVRGMCSYTENSRETHTSQRQILHTESTESIAKSDVELISGTNKLGPWRPLKRLTHYEMNHMRSLRELQPEEWTNDKLARKFGVSASAVKRILKSKFDPRAEIEERQDKKALEQRQKRRERPQSRTELKHSE